MPWYLIAGLAWIVWRKRKGLPILPFSSDPFASGAVLVPTPKGLVAVPADTPAVPAQEAIDAGLVSPQGIPAALASPASFLPRVTGAWAMFDPNAGAGPDYYVDELGQPRSNSMASRRWGTR